MSSMAHRDENGRKQLPEWLLGLLIAIVVVFVAWVWLSLVGTGDDPSFEGVDSGVDSVRVVFVAAGDPGAA